MRPPLEGIRVADFGWFGPGPTCTLMMSFLGAEVIKIETTTRARFRPGGGSPLNLGGGNVRDLDINKQSLTLNLKVPKALDVARRVIALSDVVVDNFRGPEIMRKFGLGYEDLRKLNPAIIVAHMSANGATGTESGGAGYAGIFGAISGAAWLTGYEDSPPVEGRVPMDMMSGVAGAFPILAAIYHARETGQGQFIDCSNRETFAAFMGEAFLQVQFTGQEPKRMANRDPVWAPYNVYRCKGDERWVSIAVTTEDEWRGLCKATDRAEWQRDPRFRDQIGRLEHREELDRLIGEWTASRYTEEVTQLLQEHGVAATPSANGADIMSDPHLAERKATIVTESPEGGPWITFGAPWRFSKAPIVINRRPPAPGENTDTILEELLGLGKEEIQRFDKEGVTT